LENNVKRSSKFRKKFVGFDEHFEKIKIKPSSHNTWHPGHEPVRPRKEV